MFVFNLPEPALLLFALTVFLSAALLFLLQPMLAKHLLPYFGGGAAVWTACMLFFQTMLLAGYIYAHWLCRFLSPRQQRAVHTLLLLLALVVPVMLALLLLPARALLNTTDVAMLQLLWVTWIAQQAGQRQHHAPYHLAARHLALLHLLLRIEQGLDAFTPNQR